MKKQLFTAAVISAMMFSVSCDKKGNDDEDNGGATKTPQELILGTWKSDFYAEDLNENGILDQNEIEYEDMYKSEITFNSNGTVMEVYQDTEAETPDTSYSNYSLSTDGKKLTISIDFEDEEPFSMTADVLELTSSKLLIEVADGESPKHWTSMKR